MNTVQQPDIQAQATALIAKATAQRENGSGNGRLLDQAGFIAILNKRVTVKPTDVGSSLLLQVQGQGQFLPKGHKYMRAGTETENPFDRVIYNVRASSSLMMSSAIGKEILRQAVAAESAGTVDIAHDGYNAYLNFVQLSFSVIQPSSRSFNAGDDIKAHIVSVTSQSGITSLQLEDVSYVAPKVAAKTTFSVSDLLPA